MTSLTFETKGLPIVPKFNVTNIEFEITAEDTKRELVKERIKYGCYQTLVGRPLQNYTDGRYEYKLFPLSISLN